MRLTLRTLLAYLDNTLEPADAELLGAKLRESGFATQLVQRIRRNLVAPEITALPPEAIGPVQDANTIAEFLDSNLPDEQVAEIERACLDSDVHLAEAAACHQILTMVLGKPADVPSELRQRIYELPDHDVDKIAAASQRFSSISIEDPPSQADASFGTGAAMLDVSGDQSDQLDHAGSPLSTPNASVSPVGRTDSGVSDAPTRLRESGVLDPEEVGVYPAEPAIAGSRPQTPEERIYGGTSRTRWITPWLVSLALAAALLFAFVRVFEPLMSTKMADQDTLDDAVLPGVPEVSGPVVEIDPPEGKRDGMPPVDELKDALELPPPVPRSEHPMPAPQSSSSSALDQEQIQSPGDALPRPEEILPEGMPSETTPPNKSVASPNRMEQDAPEDATTDGGDSEPDSFDDLAPPIPSGMSDSNEIAELAPPKTGKDEETDDPKGPESSLAPMDSDSPPDVAETETDLEKKIPTQLPREEEIIKPTEQKVVAMVDGADQLILTLRGNGEWKHLGEMGEVKLEDPIVCAPKFRARMQLLSDEAESSFDVTMVGPVGVRWLPVSYEDQPQPISGLEIHYGNLLVTSKQASVIIPLKLGDSPLDVTFEEEETVVAAIVRNSRRPGDDPFDPANRVQLIGLLCVQGAIEVDYKDEQYTVTKGNRWLKRNLQADPEVTPVATMPSWVHPLRDGEESSLDTSAREYLLKLTNNEKPIEVALREVCLFRRSEVVALAAQSLLLLGQADVFFGSDGVLSQPRQRQYWPGHFKALVAAIDAGADSAEWVVRGMEMMDQANSPDLLKLLEGYSPKDLENGGDKELVAYLDSDSMAVRVLALENLHKITGTTLYFRAELDTAARRAPGIKKWTTRLNRGEIRWGSTK